MPKQVKKASQDKKMNAQVMISNCQAFQKRMVHAQKPLYKTLIAATKQLLLDEQHLQNVELYKKFEKVNASLSEPSRKWATTIHWLYTVCNPQITDMSNPKYSPVYLANRGPLPPDCFGELSAFELIDSNNTKKLGKHGDKLVGDKRFSKFSTFGSAWNDKGEVVKHDSSGHPKLEDNTFSKWVYGLIDQFVNKMTANRNRDRHTEAFMIGHTRDEEISQLDSMPHHKEAHIHCLFDLPTLKSRYQIMAALGINFDDYVAQIQWISDNFNDNEDELVKRLDCCLDSLIGTIQNFTIPVHYAAALRYLVHQSKQARKDQKAVYSTKEVFSWLPDEKGMDYETIAGVDDNQAVGHGRYFNVIKVLNSDYNRRHKTEKRYVGKKIGEKAMTYDQLAQLQMLGKKQPGKCYFSEQSKVEIREQIIAWIRTGQLAFSDWQLIIHASFPDADADNLLSDKHFKDSMETIIGTEQKAILSDPSFSRNMLTISVMAYQGGMGKTRLANAMALALDKMHKAFQIATQGKNLTFDPFQNYQNETSAVLDELNPSSFSIAQLKDVLDPHKMPYISSRFHNVSPWNLKHVFITDVFKNGIAEYITKVLRYAEGVSSLGYLKKDENGTWSLITQSAEAGSNYVSQLSQLMRRLPIQVYLAPTVNGQGTEVTVSIINFKPGGRNISHFDYVYTRKSTHTFHVLVDDNLPSDQMIELAKKVLKMINDLRKKAQSAFEKNPTKLLDEIDGFIPNHYNFDVYYENGKPYLSSGNKDVDNLFPNYDDSGSTVSPSRNLISSLQKVTFKLWPDVDPQKANVCPDLNQLKALLRGYEVPIKWVHYNDVMTVKLTKKANLLVKRGEETAIWTKLNGMSVDGPLDKDKDGLLSFQINKDIAKFSLS